VEIRRIKFQSQPRGVGEEDLERPHLKQYKLGMLIHAYRSSFVGSVNREILVQTGLGINMKPYS
jgi:hypothetical protein